MFRVQFIFIGILAAMSVKAGASSNELSAAGVAEFTVAYQLWDGERFGNAAEYFRRASHDDPSKASNFYWLGVSQFHLMLKLQNTSDNRPKAASVNEAMESAIGALTQAVALQEHHAESHALLGTLYGMKINGSLLRAIRFGPQVAKHQEVALKYGAMNPRVQYLLGMCQFHTSKKSDDFQTALETLLKAAELFEGEAKVPPTQLEPRWGRSSCLTFIGCTYEKLGRLREAAFYLRKALELHPQDSVAREGLRRIS